MQIPSPAHSLTGTHGPPLNEWLQVPPLHTSSVHWLRSSHERGVPVQVVPEQASLVVQGSPSSQPRVEGVCEHVELAGMHASSVQTFPSLQASGTHCVPQHIWPVVHDEARMHIVRSVEQAAVSHVPGVGWQFALVQVPVT